MRSGCQRRKLRSIEESQGDRGSNSREAGDFRVALQQELLDRSRTVPKGRVVLSSASGIEGPEQLDECADTRQDIEEISTRTGASCDVGELHTIVRADSR